MNIVKFISISLMFIFLVSYGQKSEAKTYAYLIGTDGSILKVNTDSDSVVSNLTLKESSYVQSGENSVVADRTNNHLFVVTGRLTPYIYVYDLKTLKFVKDIGIVSGNPDVYILVSPNGKQLFIRWFDLKERGWFFDLYDAKSLTEIRNLGEFVWGPKTTFSPDGGKIYVYDTKKLKVYETTNFSLLDTIDLNIIWRTDVFAQGIPDFVNEQLLILENEQTLPDDPPKLTLFVYDIKTKKSTPRISTGFLGESKLSSDGTKIFFEEEQEILSEDKSYVKYDKSLGRLHIYDVVTGKSIGVVQFTVDRDSNILGIHPKGNKVYMVGDIQGNRCLIVLDVERFKVVKTIKISKNTLFMIFYDE